MKLNQLLTSSPKISKTSKASGPIIISTRMRIARNLDNYPFPGWAKSSEKEEVYKLCINTCKIIPGLKRVYSIKINDLCDIEKKMLVERHLISPELVKAKDAGVIITKDQSHSIMINEEDHIRIQIFRTGFDLKNIWKTANALDNTFEKYLDLSFSEDLGYLTACPTNIGTGMRASVMMHLPALTMTRTIEKIINSISQLGIAVRGIYGEGSEANGSIFQISNQYTLGESEDMILKNLCNIVKSIVKHENNTRIKIIETNRENLYDKISRAFGILKNVYLISSAEAMNLLSLIRLAIDLDFLPEKYREILDCLFIECQPAHIQKVSCQDISAKGRDVVRAKLIKKYFQDIVPLNFDINLSKSLKQVNLGK